MSHASFISSLEFALIRYQYQARYFELNNADTTPQVKKREGQKIKKLLRELSDDEMDIDSPPLMPTDPQKPWLPGFHLYLNTRDELGDMTIVQWWGVRTCSSCGFGQR